MKTKLIYAVILLLAPLLSALAHVGSSGIIVQKQAGNYQVLVSVQPPDVVPGTARVTVYIEKGRVNSVQARPVYFRSGDAGAPTHDDLQRIDGQRFEGLIWFMESGSSSVELKLDGPDGKAEIVVPVAAVATARRDMPAGTGALLVVLGLLLFVMMVTIIGASLSDGTLSPTVVSPAGLGRKRAIGMGASAVVLILLLFGGRTWWNSWADDYLTQNLYRPMPIQASVANDTDGAQLTIRVDTTNWARNSRRLSFMVPDHGKLMHVFLVRMPGLNALAHLHPNRRDTLTYQANLPDLPKGQYKLYADVVYANGFTETLTDTIDLAAPVRAGKAMATSRTTTTDPDDSYVVTTPMGQANSARVETGISICGQPGVKVPLSDGATMLWESKPGEVMESGKLYTLRFAVADATGKPAPLQPYLGMGGHAAILREDGSVYIHLHPVGTYSMAAEQELVNRIADTTRTFRYPNPKQFRDSIDTYLTKLKKLPDAARDKRLMAGMGTMNHTMNGTNHTNMVEFPYAFPKAGRYRIWVQVKRQGKVLTGAFDADVKDALM